MPPKKSAPRNRYLHFEGLIFASPDIYLRFEGVPKRDIRSMTAR